MFDQLKIEEYYNYFFKNLIWTFKMNYEKTALFIDGSNFYAATRLLNMDIDYAKLHQFFSQDSNLIRA